MTSIIRPRIARVFKCEAKERSAFVSLAIRGRWAEALRARRSTVAGLCRDRAPGLGIECPTIVNANHG
jgi:hypothetical protein